MMLFLALSLIGVGAFVAARPAFEMLRLSHQYAAAKSDAERSIYLASGETLVAIFHGTAFHISYVLGSLSGLLLSFVLLKSNVFSKRTAYLRIASSLCDFGLFIPGIGTLLSIIAVLLLMVWDLMIARRLLQLRQHNERKLLPIAEHV